MNILNKMRSQKIHRYRTLFENSEGRRLHVVYSNEYNKRCDTKFYTWDFCGKIVKVGSESIDLLLNDEYEAKIKYRNIISSYFHDTHFRIKYKLYLKKR